MRKKKAEMRDSGPREGEKGRFPMKPSPEFLEVRDWMERNKDRDLSEIFEADQKLLYGAARGKALDGDKELLKTFLNKILPDTLRIEKKTQSLITYTSLDALLKAREMLLQGKSIDLTKENQETEKT